MAETTIRDEYPTGAYILTVYADKTMHESREHFNSDGTVDMVIKDFPRSLISLDGVTTEDKDGINTVITSSPLGARYMITGYCYSTVMNMTSHIDSTVPWWNVGRMSKKAIMLSWDTGHRVANASELVAWQLLSSVWAIALISSDFYLTVQGLKGFMQQKPVMTYDLLGGLERRTLLLVIVCIGTLPSLLYADVARIYRGTANGDLIWSLSTVLVGMFFAFATFLGISVLQMFPSPTKWLLSFSPSLFSYGTIVCIIVEWNLEYENIAVEFNNAEFVLGMNVSGTFRPTGAYSADGAVTATRHMANSTTMTLIICLVIAILYSMSKRYLAGGSFFLNLSWTKTNGFLDQCTIPNWITGLNLEQSNAIKIGNKLFCKPSMQAVLGYAVVVESDGSRYRVSATERNGAAESFSKHIMNLISVYQLIPVICKFYKWLPGWCSPRIYGTIDKNSFTAAKGKHVGNGNFCHYRGACVN